MADAMLSPTSVLQTTNSCSNHIKERACTKSKVWWKKPNKICSQLAGSREGQTKSTKSRSFNNVAAFKHCCLTDRATIKATHDCGKRRHPNNHFFSEPKGVQNQKTPASYLVWLHSGHLSLGLLLECLSVPSILV